MKCSVILKLFNTIEEFKALNGQAILENIKTSLKQRGNDSLTIRMFAFADLKKHSFYYHCLYPVAMISGTCLKEHPLTEYDLALYREAKAALSSSDDHLWAKDHAILDGQLICVDPSDGTRGVVGWPIRNTLYQMDNKDEIDLVCIGSSLKNSRHLTVRLSQIATIPDVTGWERNEQRIPGHRVIDLSPLIDPIQLAKEASTLNLKLIKWRFLSILNLEKFAECRCLLFGAGTLGCNVTRLLLGWGFKCITLIDNGRVSYSNPPRQSLFRFEDCLGGGKSKSETAALRAKEIDPNAEVRGEAMTIPMLGHRIVDPEATRITIKRIQELVQEHNVLFLLTDSRESRWLPTVLGAAHNKIVITVAIGFDSFVAMRHGTVANGLSCYFCSDARAPTDTLSNRSLDQQCTVSRPGVSYLASGIAVELLASLLQHPLGNDAPAIVSADPTESLPNNASSLGAVPHQIRGFVSHFHNLQLAGDAYTNCTACSKKRIDSVLNEGVEYILKILESSIHILQTDSEKGIDSDSIRCEDLEEDIIEIEL